MTVTYSFLQHTGSDIKWADGGKPLSKYRHLLYSQQWTLRWACGPDIIQLQTKIPEAYLSRWHFPWKMICFQWQHPSVKNMRHLKLKLWTFPLKLSLISNAYPSLLSRSKSAMKWAKLYGEPLWSTSDTVTLDKSLHPLQSHVLIRKNDNNKRKSPPKIVMRLKMRNCMWKCLINYKMLYTGNYYHCHITIKLTPSCRQLILAVGELLWYWL